MKIDLVHSEVVYRGRVFQIRQDFIRLPNGNTAQIDVVDHRDSVTILPVDQQGQIWFIRQYRHPVDRFLLELPAGVAEPNEDPAANAQRELREEIGMAAGSMQLLGSFFLAPGYSNEYMHIFLAKDLHPSPLPADEDEILQIEKISARDAYELAENRTLDDSKSIIALFWARPFLDELGYL